ncbi:hypothetical protein CHS0354_010839 [Potamilus streckersoni]|uniref:Copper transport protein n=1 Tax=Potamilus streckersoni TaxID=2493646 RepID=A0AAE0W8N8_9BIVA|nr:hypothetical protein CHS0354_010839 [Potamilus streckersoni]
MGHNAHNSMMGHMNHSSMGHNHYNSSEDMGYMNQTNIEHMLHMNQSIMGRMGHLNYSDMEHMGHINHSDVEHMGHVNHSDMERMGHMDHDMHDMGYKPFFTTKTSAAMFLHQWPTDTQVGIVTALIASVIIAVALECLQEYSRITFLRISARRTGSGRFGTDLYSCLEKLFMSAIIMIRVIAGYLLMLSVMPMNVWIMMCVCLGATLGYGLGKPIVALVIHKKKQLPAKQTDHENMLLNDTKGKMLSHSPEAIYKSTSTGISETCFIEESMSMVQEK